MHTFRIPPEDLHSFRVWWIPSASTPQWLQRYVNHRKDSHQWKQSWHGTRHRTSYTTKPKLLSEKETYMKLYNYREPIHLETDASGITLGPGLLQVKEGMKFPHNEAPDNRALCPIAFTTKAYQVWKPDTVTLTVWLWSQHNHRSQTIGSYLQRCSNTSAVTTMHPTMPMWNVHIVQA